MLDTLEHMTVNRKAKPVIEIDPDQFRADYKAMPQAELMRKYGITSTRLMKLIREFVPPSERYASRVRSGFIPAAGNSGTADVS